MRGDHRGPRGCGAPGQTRQLRKIIADPTIPKIEHKEGVAIS
jgi:hypothetical protein